MGLKQHTVLLLVATKGPLPLLALILLLGFKEVSSETFCPEKIVFSPETPLPCPNSARVPSPIRD